MSFGVTALTRSETRLALLGLLWWVLEQKVRPVCVCVGASRGEGDSIGGGGRQALGGRCCPCAACCGVQPLPPPPRPHPKVTFDESDDKCA